MRFGERHLLCRCSSPAQSSPAPSPLLVDRHLGATSSLPFDICLDKLPVHPRHLPPLCQLLPIFLCSLHPSMFYPIGEPHYFALLSFLPKFLFPVHTVQSYHISSGGQPPIPPDPPPPFRKIEPHTIASESLENDLASSMQALQISDLPMHQTRCWPTTRICLHRSCRLWCCHRRFAAPPASYAARARPQIRSAAAPHLAPLRPSSATSQGRGVGPQQRRATFARLGRGGAAPAARPRPSQVRRWSPCATAPPSRRSALARSCGGNGHAAGPFASDIAALATDTSWRRVRQPTVTMVYNQCTLGKCWHATCVCMRMNAAVCVMKRENAGTGCAVLAAIFDQESEGVE